MTTRVDASEKFSAPQPPIAAGVATGEATGQSVILTVHSCRASGIYV